LNLRLRSRALSAFFQSFASSVGDYSPKQRSIIWQGLQKILEPELALVPISGDLCFQWPNLVLALEISQYDGDETEDVKQSEDPFRMATIPADSGPAITKAYRDTLVQYWQLGGRWEEGTRQAALRHVRIITEWFIQLTSIGCDCSTWSALCTCPGVLGQ